MRIFVDSDQGLPDGDLVESSALVDKLNQFCQITSVIHQVRSEAMRFKLWCFLIVHLCKLSLNGINVHGRHSCKFIVAGLAVLYGSQDLRLPISQLGDQLFFLFNGWRVW